jgi:hypothetical protein
MLLDLLIFVSSLRRLFTMGKSSLRINFLTNKEYRVYQGLYPEG